MKHLLSNESKGPVGLIVSVIVLIVVFSFLNPRFASVENLQNVLFQSSVPLIIVVGATLVIIMGSIDLSVQGVMGAAGMAWILITPNTRTELDYGAWAWVIALATGVLLGLFAGLIYDKLKVPSFVATLGMFSIARGLTMLWTGGFPITGLGDSCRCANHNRSGTVRLADTSKPANYFSDVRAEYSSIRMTFVDDDVAQPAQEWRPALMGAEHRVVNEIRVGEHVVRVIARPVASLDCGIAVIRGGTKPGESELREGAKLIIGQGLGG